MSSIPWTLFAIIQVLLGLLLIQEVEGALAGFGNKPTSKKKKTLSPTMTRTQMLLKILMTSRFVLERLRGSVKKTSIRDWLPATERSML